jgi:tetratricopeptide (TPR) repeat protein
MKNKIRYSLFLIVFSFGVTLVNAQQSKLDSLEKVAKNAKDDTTRVIAYINQTEILCLSNPDTVIPICNNVISIVDRNLPNANGRTRYTFLLYKAAAISNSGYIYYGKGQIDKSIEYFEKALKLQEEIDAKSEVANSLSNIGAMYSGTGQMEKALDYLLRALKIQREIGQEKGIAYSLNNIASIYSSLGQTEKALEYLYQSLKLQEKLGDKVGASSTLNNLGALYMRVGQTEKALEFYNRSLKIRESLDDKLGMTISYNNIGNAYDKRGDQEKALMYYNKSLLLAQSIGNKNGMANCLNNIATIYVKQGKYDSVQTYYQRSMKLYDEIGDQAKVSNSYANIGFFLIKTSKPTEALREGEHALEIAEKGNFVENMRNAHLLISQADSALKNSAGAYEHFKKYIALRDSMVSESTKKAGIKKDMQYEYDKKEAVLKAEQEKERVIAQEKSRKQKVITWSVAGGLFLVVLFAVFVFRSLRVTRKQKHIIELKNIETEQQKRTIEEKNKDITDSIIYAKRIQQAKLPKKEEIVTCFPQCFILYKPKDIVSGDFYFFHSENGTAYIAAADCTGHGVPGALMSMIGSEKLNDSIKKNSSPSEILKSLNQGIKSSLRQSENDDSTRDGMDIGLCVTDLKTKTIKFSGANRPLWTIRNGNPEIEEIKGTKHAIGGSTNDDQHFESHELKMNQGDTIYLFSDGYADLFGGKNGKKLTSKKFKKILEDIQNKSMPEQETYLNDFAESWKADTEQVDDILVIGIRF